MPASERRTRVDETNQAQAQAWDGTEGDYWAHHADRFDRSIAGYQDRFADAAAIRRRDLVLDIGCGTGWTTCEAARAATDGEALGVDLSRRMIEVARRRAERAGLRNAQFLHADAQVYPFHGDRYDLAISRTGAMFFGQPVAAFANLARAVRPAGRLVLLTWRPPGDNAWIRTISGALAGAADAAQAPAPADSPGPFSMSDPDRIAAVLGEAGWTQVRIEPLEAPMWFGLDAQDAVHFLRGLFAGRLEQLPEPARQEALERLRTRLTEHERPGGVQLDSAAWLTTARRMPPDAAGSTGHRG